MYPSISAGQGPGSPPSQPITNTAPARNAKPLFVSLPRILFPGWRAQLVADGWTDGQMGISGLGWGWQPTGGRVDTPEVKKQHCRVREVEGHLEKRPRKG